MGYRGKKIKKFLSAQTRVAVDCGQSLSNSLRFLPLGAAQTQAAVVSAGNSGKQIRYPSKFRHRQIWSATILQAGQSFQRRLSKAANPFSNDRCGCSAASRGESERDKILTK
jgi:hypothetical protein